MKDHYLPLQVKSVAIFAKKIVTAFSSFLKKNEEAGEPEVICD